MTPDKLLFEEHLHGIERVTTAVLADVGAQRVLVGLQVSGHGLAPCRRQALLLSFLVGRLRGRQRPFVEGLLRVPWLRISRARERSDRGGVNTEIADVNARIAGM